MEITVSVGKVDAGPIPLWVFLMLAERYDKGYEMPLHFETILDLMLAGF